MRALNTPGAARQLVAAAVDPEANSFAVQGCLSVLVRLIEWHAQNLQADADEEQQAPTDSIDFEDNDEVPTPKAAGSGVRFGSAPSARLVLLATPSVSPLPLLIAEILRQMPRLMSGLLQTSPTVQARTFSNGDVRVPFGLVRLQAVELLTHMVYVRHPEVAACMRRHRVLLRCLELALEYEMNNVLHGVVASAVAAMCEEFDLATTTEDYKGLFEGCSSAEAAVAATEEQKTQAAALNDVSVGGRNDRNLVNVILDAYELSDTLKEKRGYQSCYLGHVHIMANVIHQSSIKAAQIMEAHPDFFDDLKNRRNKEQQQEEEGGSGAATGAAAESGGGDGGTAEAPEETRSLIPPPPSGPAPRSASITSLANSAPPAQYTQAALEVAYIIVTACATNARWRKFVDDRLPVINQRRECSGFRMVFLVLFRHPFSPGSFSLFPLPTTHTHGMQHYLHRAGSTVGRRRRGAGVVLGLSPDDRRAARGSP